MSPDQWVALALLGRAHGLNGAILLHPYNQATEALVVGARVRLTLKDGAERRAVLTEITATPKAWIVRFEGISERAHCLALNLARVELQRKDFPPLAEGEFYHVDLVGVSVYDPEGQLIGSVSRVEPWPTVDSIVIVRQDRAAIEAPMVPGVLIELDLQAQRITIDLDALKNI